MNETSDSRRHRHDHGDDQPLIKAVSHWLKDLLRSRNGDDSMRAAIEEIIEEHGDGESPIDTHERILLGNILRTRDVTAYDVMVPRADIVAIDMGSPLKQVIEVMAAHGHSRLPVYRGTLDDVVGMVHIKDVLAMVAAERSVPLQAIVRRILFVSPSIRIMDMLMEMRMKRTHMALVVDEYGGIDGLVTIEDVVEEVVGEIEDEHDVNAEPEFLLSDDGTATADARVSIEDFEERVGRVLSDDEREDADTLGGLVFYLAGRVPARGELILHSSGIEFEVLDADPRRVKRLRLRNVPVQAVVTE